MAYFDVNLVALPDSNSDLNLWADNIELLCLLSPDDSIGVQQICDRLVDSHGGVAEDALTDVADAEDILELDDSLAIEGGEEELIDITRDNPAAGDKIEAKVQTFFDFLKARQALFGESYPFIVKNKEIRKKCVLSDAMELYTILLASSLLRFMTRSARNHVGHKFEQLCGPAFNRLIPIGSSFHLFGSGLADKGVFNGTFFNKVETLAKMLHVDVHPKFNTTTVSKNNVGDGGLDWVGFLNFADDQEFIPLFFGQCACGSEWQDKQFDAIESKWKKYLLIETDYLCYHFIPRSFRKANNEWQNNREIINVVLLDRLRLIELLATTKGLSDFLIEIYSEFLEEMCDLKIDDFT